MTKRTFAAGLAILLLGLGACQGRTVYAPTGSGSPDGAGSARRAPVRRGGSVFLSDRDLAPVDAFVSARNAQWILGDEIEVVASKEYFGQVLTLNNAVGSVHRTDVTRADETVVTLVYRGVPGSVTVTTAPRVMIGTGITVDARKRLVLRLVKTQDANVPVHLRITAKGKASRGRRDEVTHRDEILTLGGQIRNAGGQWRWFPIQ